MTTFQVTKIQFFDQTQERQIGEFETETVLAYSANVFINDEFVIQVSGTENEAHKPSFPPSADCCYASTEEAQEAASENYDIDEIIDQIEAAGFENNFYFLSENADEKL